MSGTHVGSRAAAGVGVTSTGPLRVGGSGVRGEYFRGRLHEVRLYARALSASEPQTDVSAPVKTT